MLLESEAAHPSPEEIVEMVARILSANAPGAEVRIGTLSATADGAIVYGYVTGVGDDAVAGEEFRYFLRAGVGGWFVERIDQRVHCRRDVTPEALCV